MIHSHVTQSILEPKTESKVPANSQSISSAASSAQQNSAQGLVHWMSAVMAEHMTSSSHHHPHHEGMHYMWNEVRFLKALYIF